MAALCLTSCATVGLKTINLAKELQPTDVGIVKLQTGGHIVDITGDNLNYKGAYSRGAIGAEIKLPPGQYKVSFIISAETYSVSSPITKHIKLNKGETKYLYFLPLTTKEIVYSWISDHAPNSPGWVTDVDLAHCVAEEHLSAIDLCMPLAENGNIKAMRQLSKIYEKSDTVQRNKQEAFKWMKKAADSGDAFSQANTGYYYLWGIGTKQSLEQGKHYTELAVEAEEITALTRLSASYNRGWFTPVDKEKSYELSKKVLLSGSSFTLTYTVNQMLRLAEEQQNEEQLKDAYSARSLTLMNIKLNETNKSHQYLLSKNSSPHSNISPERIINSIEDNNYLGKVCLAPKNHREKDQLKWTVNSFSMDAESKADLNNLDLSRKHFVTIHNNKELEGELEISFNSTDKNSCIEYSDEFSEWRLFFRKNCDC